MKNTNKKIMLLALLHFLSGISQEIKVDLKINATGSVRVKEEINGVTAKDTLLLHKNIPLTSGNEHLLKNGTDIYRGIYREYLKSAGRLDYLVNVPKPHYDNFFFKESVFFIAENYLAMKKNTFNSKKQIAFNITLPPNLVLVYPQKEDLKQTFYTAPPIIAGNFKEELYKDYLIYQREDFFENQKRKNQIVDIIAKSFEDFQKIFEQINHKPKIVFMPFEGNLAGKNIYGLLALNEKFLQNDYFNKRILIHEILHLWWGDNSIRFENPVLTEAITEFFTLRYLMKEGDINYLKQILAAKQKNAGELKGYDLTFAKIENQTIYNTYCYDLVPLLIMANEDAENILINFYKSRQNSFVTEKQGHELLEKLGIKIKTL